MTQMIFVNLPVTDIARSRAFYAALGLTFDERFCTGEALMANLSDEIRLMLLRRDHFASFTTKAVADPRQTASALISLSRDSRAAVEETMARALAAGGTDNGDVHEMGDYMYGRSFSDPDGNGFGLMWMDVERAMAAWSQAA